MKSKEEIKVLSLSTYNKLEELYPKWIKKYSFLTILSTRFSCRQLLQKLQGDTSNIFVIDCVSNENHKQSISVSSLRSLTGMALAISTLLKNNKIDLLVIDSLSNLIIHNDSVSVLKFSNDLSQKARKNSFNLIFPILEKDREGKLAAIELYADKIEKM